MNKTLLIGRLTATPELTQTPTGKNVSHVTVAVNRRFKNENGEREADFLNVVVWGKLAETLVSYAGKGSLISIEGELRTRKYEKDGSNRYVTEVLCQAFQLLESRATPTKKPRKVESTMPIAATSSVLSRPT